LAGKHAAAVRVPAPVESSASRPPVQAGAHAHAPDQADGRQGRDIAALTYAGDPEKKQLDLVLRAWQTARRDDEQLVVAGIDAVQPRAGVTVAGRVSPPEFRALLRRARAFVAAPRREDYGIAPLEALADGCLLVTTPAPGPYPALELARRLDPRLVSDDLATAIRIALDEPVPGYASRAAELLVPFSAAAVDRTIAEDVLPKLLPGWP
jgi:hypothetical protein